MAAPAVVAVAIGGLFGVALGGLMPVAQGISQSVFPFMPTTLPDPATLVTMRWRKIIDEATYLDWAAKLGYSNPQAENMFQVSQLVWGHSNLKSVGSQPVHSSC